MGDAGWVIVDDDDDWVEVAPVQSAGMLAQLRQRPQLKPVSPLPDAAAAKSPDIFAQIRQRPQLKPVSPPPAAAAAKSPDIFAQIRQRPQLKPVSKMLRQHLHALL
jgi:hypothetical protein